MQDKRFHGIVPALITPMSADGSIDWASYVGVIQRCLDAGVHGFVPAGTTGESPTLSHDEHDEVISVCVREAGGRVPVIAGTGSNSTAEAVRLTRHAESVGADAALVVSPYYNKPTQEGLYHHYRAIAESTSLPIIIYNIPGRCIVDVLPETMFRLASDCGNIVGVKDATNYLERPEVMRHLIGDKFCQLSGNDDTFGAFLGMGGDGIISVAANAVPELYVGMYEAFCSGDLSKFEEFRGKIFPLSQALFCESSPSPVKYACSRLGLCGEHVRLPLMVATAGARAEVDEALRIAGLLN